MKLLMKVDPETQLITNFLDAPVSQPLHHDAGPVYKPSLTMQHLQLLWNHLMIHMKEHNVNFKVLHEHRMKRQKMIIDFDEGH